jgi:hypothetical protein
MKKHADIVYDRFMETGFVEFDAYTPVGKAPAGKPKGTIELAGDNIINSDPNATPVVRLTIKSRIPADSLPTENNYVYRHTLRLKNQEVWDQDDIVLGCEVDAKNPSRVDVKQFDKNYNLQATDKTYKPAVGDLIKAEDKIAAADSDKKLFKAKAASIEGVDFIETQCVIAIKYDDRVRKFSDKIFDKFYAAEIGLQYFDKKATKQPYSLCAAKQSTEAFLPVPEFRDEFNYKPSAKFFEHGYNMRSAQVNEVSYRDVAWEWKVTKETNKPDQLRVTFFSTFDKSSVATKNKVEQFIEFYPSFDRSKTPKREVIGCEYDASSDTFAPFYKKDVTTDFSAANLATVSGYKTQTDWKLDATASKKEMGKLVGADQMTVNCTITKDFDKMTRDYSVFMKYKGKSGVRAFAAGGAAEDFGIDDTEFLFSEPQYDFGEVSDGDFIVQPMDERANEFFAEDLDATKDGFGELRMNTQYMLSPYFFADDKLRASFELDIPESFIPANHYVFQYVQLTPDNDPGSVYISITCTTQVGVKNSQRIVEYQGTSLMNQATMAGQTIFKQNSA